MKVQASPHTRLEQFYANKQNNSLGGLKWIQRAVAITAWQFPPQS